MRSILPQLRASADALEQRIAACETLLTLPLGKDFLRTASLQLDALRTRLTAIRSDIATLEAAYAKRGETVAA